MPNKFKDFIINLIPTFNTIFFESQPTFSDNTRCVFEELVARGYNKKYKMIWQCNNKSKNIPKFENVKFINLDAKFGRFLYRYYVLTSKCLICCNDFLVPQKRKQISIYLTHGTPIKSLRNYYNIPGKINICISSSEEMKDLFSYEFKFDKSKLIATGLPRNDLLTNHKTDIKKILKTNCKNIIIWYPTYRQNKSDDESLNKNALPIIHDINSAVKLNECAKENNILIVLKPHFAQNLSYVKDLNLSNIRFINDDFYTKNNIQAYEFIGNCDALITDYSSIYFDYLICNKPIAAIWEDIEDYKAKTGLVENYEYYMSGAEKIYNIDDFIIFLNNLANGIDALSEERKIINSVVNFANDGKNTERVVDLIIKKANLKL